MLYYISKVKYRIPLLFSVWTHENIDSNWVSFKVSVLHATYIAWLYIQSLSRKVTIRIIVEVLLTHETSRIEVTLKNKVPLVGSLGCTRIGTASSIIWLFSYFCCCATSHYSSIVDEWTENRHPTIILLITAVAYTGCSHFREESSKALWMIRWFRKLLEIWETLYKGVTIGYSALQQNHSNGSFLCFRLCRYLYTRLRLCINPNFVLIWIEYQPQVRKKI